MIVLPSPPAGLPGTLVSARIARSVLKLYAFALSGAFGLALTMSAYSDELRSTWLSVVFAGILLLCVLKWRKWVLHREFFLYVYFFIYMLLSLLWTKNLDLAVNTLIPALNCILVFLIFGALTNFCDWRAILRGILCGFLVGIAAYTVTQGFPFSYPDEFSYNAIAGMYLFGLVVTLLYGCLNGSKLIVLPLAVVVMLHIVATTSIKTNLGILLGVIFASMMYFRQTGAAIRRNFLALMILSAGIAYGIATHDSILESLQHGVDRVSIGVEVLQARDDVKGYSAYQERDYWRALGIEGWRQNPVFGYGVEAFRADAGITSHSTPIDLLYNSGVIGLALFYAMFLSLAWRLWTVRARGSNSAAVVVFGCVVCYGFMSLSEPLHYNAFFVAFVSISTSIIERTRVRALRENDAT